MKLEQQVVSLELAQKLKELGVKQESFLYWTERWMPHQKEPYVLDMNIHGKQYSAFTVAELGEMLPKGCFTTKTESDEFPWRCEYKGGYGVIASGADTEADARAKMLVYLLENNLIN